ncbi:MAG: RNA polymerase sigma factor RpoD, partial [Acidobacteriota bacterium]|nr:RNA polymerase sigma factor RpoD [Acidobacteriota bacterium]
MDLNNGGELEDLLAGFDGADIDILEEPKLELDKKPDEAEELLDLERPAGTSDKTEDPFRLYVREMRSVPLLKREGEVE